MFNWGQGPFFTAVLTMPNKGAAGNSDTQHREQAACPESFRGCPFQLRLIYEICLSSLHSTSRSAAVPELWTLGCYECIQTNAEPEADALQSSHGVDCPYYGVGYVHIPQEARRADTIANKPDVAYRYRPGCHFLRNTYLGLVYGARSAMP